MLDYTKAHQFIRDICQVGATKAAMPSATPEQRQAIRDMAIAAAELAYGAIDFEQYMNIAWEEHRTVTQRRSQFVEAIMRSEEAKVAEFVRELAS